VTLVGESYTVANTGDALARADPLMTWLREDGQRQTAPADAEPTSFAYLASTPVR
jgi:hypothetical protein